MCLLNAKDNDLGSRFGCNNQSPLLNYKCWTLKDGEWWIDFWARFLDYVQNQLNASTHT
jgi:hypothetical protein